MSSNAAEPAPASEIATAYRRLREDCGLVDAGPVDRLRLGGADRQRFLGGLVTCEVKVLEPGQGAYGFFTDIKGRLLADAVILADADALWLELPAGTAAAIEAHLLKYRIADRVEVEPIAGARWLSVVGPDAGAVLDSDLRAADWSHTEVSLFGAPMTVFRDRRLGAPALSLRVDAETAERILAAARGATDDRSLAIVDPRALEIVRVEAGRPRFGVDMSGDNFPQETGLEAETVSYSKGCYLGQEIVARIHYRGGVNRRLTGLSFASDADQSGRELSAGGRGVGTVTSFVRSPRHGPIGLAIVHRRAEDGSQVEVEGGATARLVPLPFDS